MPKQAKKQVRKSLPADSPPVIEAESGNQIQQIITRLTGGESLTNQRERRLVFQWNRLSRPERAALAAEWDLPLPQTRDKKLAEIAQRRLA